MTTISRHYVRVDGRHVHYRQAGRGPLLLLLHQSPQSSLDYVELMGRWAERFTMIAPDRAGCGQSDPLPDAAPDFDQYGDATVRFLDALGIARVPIYGFHTGASEALSIAARHPQRVLAVAANGVSAMNRAELEEIERDYLPHVVPRWDGGHLAWLWARMREQTVFFPWFKRSAASRMSYDMAPPERTQRHVLDLLRNWSIYGVAYGAAFKADGVAALRESRAPTLVCAAQADPLHAHLARLGVTRPGLEIRGLATAAEAENAARDFLLQAAHAVPPAQAPAPPASSVATEPLLLALAAADAASGEVAADARVRGGEAGGVAGAAPARGFVGAAGQELQVVHRAPAAASVAAATASRAPRRGRLVVLHDATSSIVASRALLDALAAAGFEVIAPDLPGHGESAPLASADGSVVNGRALAGAPLLEALAQRIATGLKPVLGETPVTLLGIGAGANVALALAAHSGRGAMPGLRSIVAWQPSCWPDEDRADVVAAFASVPAIDWHGGQLSHAWHRARDAGLYHPWCLRRRINAWQGEPRVDDLDIHERCVALLLSGPRGPALATAAAADDLRARLEASRVPVQLFVDAASPARYLDAVQAQLGGTRASIEALAGESSVVLAARLSRD